MIRNIAILKTDKLLLSGTKIWHKHPTYTNIEKLNEGDLLLIEFTKSSTKKSEKRIQYCMEFISCDEDINNFSDKIWHKHLNYIVSGSNFYELENPFNIEKIQISEAKYDKARWLVYLEDLDIELLYSQGYLKSRT